MEEEQKAISEKVEDTAAHLEEGLGDGLVFPSVRPWDPEKPRVRTRLLRIVVAAAVLLLFAASAAAHFAGRSGPDADPILTPLDEADTLSLRTGSDWRGIMTISELKGKGALRSGEAEVCAVIGEMQDGTPYFEIFDGPAADPGAVPLLSMRVLLEPRRLIPVLDAQDAWLFRLMLDERDTEELTFRLVDSQLSIEGYHFNDGQQRCTVRFLLSPAG